MERKYKILIISVIFLFFLIFFEIMLLKNHERVHKDISYYHGCNDSRTDIKISYDSTFRCLTYSNITYEMRLQEEFLHSLHEIISYNLYPFYYLILFLIYFIIVFSI